MKYAVILGDGMADWGIDRLGGKTCLEAARTPVFDGLVPRSEIGLFTTVPEGLSAGSDVANMCVMGFDPKKYYTGRSPLEAVSMGINLLPTDVTLRCNFVTLSDEKVYADKTMLDYTAGDISTEEAGELLEYLKKRFETDGLKFYTGISYRHCTVVKDGEKGGKFTPPHDVTDKKIADYLPSGKSAEKYLSMMIESYGLLKDHPVNAKRVAEGKNPANSIWFWGEGTYPALENFHKLHGLNGAVISAVDLVNGIGILAGLKVITVDGATGNYETNFKGKAEAAANALLNGCDLVYLHIDAPDECAHRGDYENKIYSIERVDEAAGRIIDAVTSAGEDIALLICPDHYTPCALKTHTAEPVPYMIYSSKHDLGNGVARYCEREAKSAGKYEADGYKLIEKLFSLK